MHEGTIPISELTQPLLVRLLYEGDPGLHLERLTPELDDDITIELLDDGDGDEELRFARDVDGMTFSVTLLPSGTVRRSELQDDLDQTFAWLDADDTTRSASTGILAAEIGPEPLPPLVRVEAFTTVLRGVIEATQPIATQWLRSSHLVAPDTVCSDIFAGPVNVRMFGDAEAADEWVMDTLGLGALGLLDVQCHFRGLDPGLVAGWLSDLSHSLIRDSSLPDDDALIPGLDGSTWRCRYEPSLTPPNRSVLDIDPGGEHSGGIREP
ncbi:MAG: DUF4261 domain-containing protein [Acidimicrobiia bacterium]|nr:DUF4261 domain-containing protein [Acidimicrobiia bacterium]